MTGLDELRGYARRMDKLHVWPGGARLREIADQIEQEHDAEVADSPYDAILPEDREAAAWVREHGGLDAVRSEWRSRVPYEWGRRRLLDHIAECETALGRRNQRIEDLGHRVSDLTTENAELRRRAMPDGCEWPRFDDGKPVLIGDMVELNTVVAKVCGVFISEHGYVLHGKSGENTGSDTRFDYPNFVRAKRPKQEPVGADDLPIRNGDEVWAAKDGNGPFKVVLIDLGAEFPITMTHGDGDILMAQCTPDELTHTKPVIGADHLPIKKGETVWDVEDGRYEMVVSRTELDELDHVGVTQEKPTPANVSIHPSRLTHTKPEPPDSWEKWRDDMLMSPRRYVLEVMKEKTSALDSSDVNEKATRDLERRAKALAERERAE